MRYETYPSSKGWGDQCEYGDCQEPAYYVSNPGTIERTILCDTHKDIGKYINTKVYRLCAPSQDIKSIARQTPSLFWLGAALVIWDVARIANLPPNKSGYTGAEIDPDTRDVVLWFHRRPSMRKIRCADLVFQKGVLVKNRWGKSFGTLDL